MKHVATFFALLWLVSASFTTLLADNAPPGQLTVTVSKPRDAHICGTASLDITFANAGPATIGFNNINVDLDNQQNGLITLLGLTNSPDFNVVSGIGTSNPVLSTSKKLGANQQLTVTLEIQYSCLFWDMPNQLKGYRTQATGSVFTLIQPQETYPYNQLSDYYEIKYTEINPNVNLPVVEANVGTPFSLNVPLEIGGNFCDADFSVVMKGIPACFDFSQASVAIIRNDVAYISNLTLSPSNGAIHFEINALTLGIPAFCEENYPGGMGELRLLISNVLIPCNCVPADATYPIEIGFTPCGNDESPADCLVGGQVVPQVTVTQEIYVAPIPIGQITIEETGGNTLSFCNTLNTLTLALSNPEDFPAYYIDLDFMNQMGYAIFNIKMNGVNVPFQQGASVHLDFSNNTNANLGLQDLNFDQIYEELAPGASVTVVITFRNGDPNHCAIGGSGDCNGPCVITTVPNPLIQAIAHWGDRCNTPASIMSSEKVYAIKLPNVTLNAKSTVEKIPYNTTTFMSVELAGGELEGVSGYLQQGNIRRYLCVSTTADVLYESATLNGQAVSISPTGYIDLGTVSPQALADGIVEIGFQLLSCGIDKTVTFNFSYGFYFENCPNCKLTIACGNMRFLTPCSNSSSCNSFASINMAFYNDIYAPLSGPVPNPAKVYPCDCINVNVSTVLAVTVFADKFRVGFKVADDMLGYFKTPFPFNGTFTATIPGGQNIPLFFNPGIVAPIPAEPYSIVYFSGTMPVKMVPGTTITGSFTICMDDDFPIGFDKIDFFSPVVGADVGGTVEYCFIPGPQLYGLEPDYILEETVTASCADGGLFTATLTKMGGELYGPDFPGKPRVAAAIVGKVNFRVAGGDPAYHLLSNNGSCTELPNPYLFFANTLPQPTGLEKQGDILQQFQLRFEENCAGNVPVDVSYIIQYRPGANQPCSSTETHTATYQETGAVLPFIVSRPDPLLGSIEYTTEKNLDINIQTTNEGGDASNAWIQIEYNPALVNINPASVTGPVAAAPFTLNLGLAKNVLVIPINGLADVDGTVLVHGLTIEFLDKSCATGGLLDIYGMHRCGCTPFGGYGSAASYDDPGVCQDSYKTLLVKQADADLSLSPIICEQPLNRCDEFAFSVVLSNNEAANLENVLALLTVPPGAVLVEATYQIGPGTSNCSSSTNSIDIAAITSTGWSFPGSTLFGYASGIGNNERRVQLYFRFTGSGINPAMDNFTITASGTKPCGSTVTKSHTFTDVYGQNISNITGVISVPYQWCLETSPDIVPVFVVLTIPGATFTTMHFQNARLYCDANQNGVVDAGEELLFTNPGGFLNSIPNQLNKYRVILQVPKNQLDNCLNTNQVILTFDRIFVEGIEYCPNPIVDDICCLCLPMIGQTPKLTENANKGFSGTDLSETTGLQSEVYPNPGTGLYTLSASSSYADLLKVHISDQYGKQVWQSELSLSEGQEGMITLDIQDLPAGMYYLMLTSQQEQRQHILIKI
jgi:hypothetical protein